jgi:hypothetical protein
VIVTATESQPPGSARGLSRRALVAALGALCLLAGCAEEPLPQRRLSVDDCLTNVQLDHLNEALERCDRVVASYPKEPQPLNERFLLHWLKGDEAAACRDIHKAAELARRLSPAKLDRLLRRDLELRVASCREETTDKPGTETATRGAGGKPGR